MKRSLFISSLLAATLMLSGCTVALPQLSEEADQPTLTVTEEQQAAYADFLGDIGLQLTTVSGKILVLAGEFLKDPKNIEAVVEKSKTLLFSFTDELRGIRSELEAMEVPPMYAEQHEQLLADLDAADASIEKIKTGLSDGNLLVVLTGVIELQGAMESVPLP